jgi:hypothetical protein
MAHTILLVLPGSKPESRTYADYESVNECMEVPALYYLVATGNSVHISRNMSIRQGKSVFMIVKI